MIEGYFITAPDKHLDGVMTPDKTEADAAYARLKARSKWPDSVNLWNAWLFNYGERNAWWEPRTIPGGE